MLTPGALATAFQTYWDEMERCRLARAYWSLLHVCVCLPDICAALESSDGVAHGWLYSAWCDKYLDHPLFSGAERYDMRCKVLHQGRATTEKTSRYTGFAFGQPSDSGAVDHLRVEAGTLHLDVGELARETHQGMQDWIAWLEANPSSTQAAHVQQHLPSLVKVSMWRVPAGPNGGQVQYNFSAKTN